MAPARNRHRRRAAATTLAACAALAVAAGIVTGQGSRSDAESRPPEAPTAGPQAAAGATPAPQARERDRLRRLGAERLAGETVILRYAGPTVPAYVRRALREGRAAGAILFADNLPDEATARRATRVLQRAGRGRAIVTLDQEGGFVRRVPTVAPRRGQRAHPSPAAARRSARAAGRDLAALGFTVNLAPVADVGRPGSALESRTYPGDTARTARFVAAAVRGYRGTGVAPTVKHFPGLGAADGNTDDVGVDIDLPARTIGRADLPPFQAAIAAGVPLVMLSHARYPALDPDAIASQSRPIVTGLLKRRLGFRGVVITDALEARAVGAAQDPGSAAVRSARAGADLILTTGPGSHRRVLRALERRARERPAFRARLVDAALRVRALRDR